MPIGLAVAASPAGKRTQWSGRRGSRALPEPRRQPAFPPHPPPSGSLRGDASETPAGRHGQSRYRGAGRAARPPLPPWDAPLLLPPPHYRPHHYRPPHRSPQPAAASLRARPRPFLRGGASARRRREDWTAEPAERGLAPPPLSPPFRSLSHFSGRYSRRPRSPPSSAGTRRRGEVSARNGRGGGRGSGRDETRRGRFPSLPTPPPLPAPSASGMR